MIQLDFSDIDWGAIVTGTAKEKKAHTKGMTCEGCKEFNEYAEPNQPDDTFKCYKCRKNL